MKKIILTVGILLAINTGVIFSQSIQSNKNILRIESGSAFTGSGDIYGFCFYNEYSRLIGNRFKISPSLGLLNFYNDVNQDISLAVSSNALSFELAGYYLPIKRDRFAIELGLGGYYRNWQWTYATGDNQYYLREGLTLGPNSYAAQTRKGLGYSVSIGTGIEITEILGINLRAVYQIDTNGDNALSGRIGLNIKF